jgi:hypothetical protein
MNQSMKPEEYLYLFKKKSTATQLKAGNGITITEKARNRPHPSAWPASVFLPHLCQFLASLVGHPRTTPVHTKRKKGSSLPLPLSLRG